MAAINKITTILTRRTKIINISQKFNLKIKGHADIAFIDVDERLDTKLFLDPYVIQALSDKFCSEARKCIDTFFKELFCACREQDNEKLRRLLKYASEPNETNLGMKSLSDYGKGATAAVLTNLFLEFYKIVCKNPHIESNPLALCMYIKNFDKDKMSDLITNIIRKPLYNFTVEQSAIWNMPLESNEVLIGAYWNYDSLDWHKLYGMPLSVGHNNILLVPKAIVRSRYVFNVECYIKQYILKTVQQDHTDQNSDMCSTKEYADGRRVIVPPTIEDLYKHEVHGAIHKDYAFFSSSTNKFGEEKFVKDMLRRINDGYGSLTDAQLDEIVYKRHAQSA